MPSVADLVEERALAELVAPEPLEAGRSLANGGAVRFVELGPVRVVAEVAEEAAPPARVAATHDRSVTLPTRATSSRSRTLPTRATSSPGGATIDAHMSVVRPIALALVALLAGACSASAPSASQTEVPVATSALTLTS